MKGLIQKINDNWMVVLDQRTWQDPSAEDLIIPLHIDDLWVIDHTGYIVGKNQELDFEITTVEEGVTDCGTHIIYKDYAKLIRRPTKKEAMTPSEILMKHEDANEYHFHEVDRKWIIEAMEEYATFTQTEISDAGKNTADYIDRHIIESMKELAIEGFKPQTPEISDEEIEKAADKYVSEDEFNRLLECFEQGAKWYREQLKQKI